MMPMEIAGFIPQSFSDWPGNACAVIFTPKCNFRCGFCHNSNLVLTPEKIELKNEQKIIKFLEKQKWAIEGVVITGGEPTLQKDLEKFCEKLKKIGLKIKLDTNGSNPEIIKRLVEKKLIDFIAMDLKAPFQKYRSVTGVDFSEKVEKTKNFIIKSGIDHEFRTTFVPGLIEAEDMEEIVEGIKNAKRFCHQQFIPRNCLDKKFEKIRKPSYAELEKIIKNLKFKGEIRIRSEKGEVIAKCDSSLE